MINTTNLTICVLGFLGFGVSGFFLRGRENLLRIVLVAVCWMIFGQFGPLDFEIISVRPYRGDANSMDVHILDMLCVLLLVALPRRTEPIPYKFVFGFYFLVAAASALTAPMPIFVWLGVWKLIRGWLVLLAISRACESVELTPWVLNGLGSGVVFSGLYALFQRYARGFIQTSAAFDHQNTLGMMVNLFAPIALAVLLSSYYWRMSAAVVALGGIAIILTQSRGSLAIHVVEILLVFMISLWRRYSQRKAYALVGLIIVGTAVGIKSFDTIMRRFQEASPQSELSRKQFEQAAELMLQDFPMGVGLNHYPFAMKAYGYATAVNIPAVDQDGVAHNIYWLTLSEVGYLGMFAYALLMLMPLLLAIHGARIAPHLVRADMLLGCAVALLMTYVHSKAEWIPRQMPMVYLFYAVAGLVASVTQQLRREKIAQDEAKLLAEYRRRESMLAAAPVRRR